MNNATAMRTVLMSTLLIGATAFFGQAIAADVVEAYEPVTAEANADPTRNGFSITPYFWATIYNGTMTIDGQTVDMTGTTVFDLLDSGDLRFVPLVVALEWDRGQWGGFIDGTLIGLEFGTGDFSLGPGPFTSNIGLDFTYGLVNAGLTYQLMESQSGGFTNEVDLMPGIRYTYYDVDLAGNVGPNSVTFNETLDWVDGFVGLRARGKNQHGFNYTLYGDIGGGAGLSAQAFAIVGKEWSYNSFDMNVFAGYRYLYQDWSSGNNAVDLSTHGPLVGLQFKF